MHVTNGIQMHERRYARHHHQHHGRQTVDPQHPIHREIAAVYPCTNGHDLRMAHKRNIIKRNA